MDGRSFLAFHINYIAVLGVLCMEAWSKFTTYIVILAAAILYQSFKDIFVISCIDYYIRYGRETQTKKWDPRI